jgi:large subunit ribosomal protein L21
MYAVIKAGGKQQKVKPGDVIEIDHVSSQDGESVTFTPLLVVDDEGRTHVGKDLGKAVVRAKLLGEQKGDKVRVFKYRPKTGYSRRQGHRQLYTLIEIEDVSLSGTASGEASRPSRPSRPRASRQKEVEGAMGTPETGEPEEAEVAEVARAAEDAATPEEGEPKGVFSGGVGSAGEEEFRTEDASAQPAADEATAEAGEPATGEGEPAEGA